MEQGLFRGAGIVTHHRYAPPTGRALKSSEAGHFSRAEVGNFSRALKCVKADRQHDAQTKSLRKVPKPSGRWAPFPLTNRRGVCDVEVGVISAGC